MTRLMLVALILLGMAAAGAAGRDGQVDDNLRWGLGVFSPTPTMPKADQLVVVSEAVAGDTKLNKCAAGTPMRLGEKTYEHGIGVNSYSVLRVELTRPAARFEADIGLDRNVDGTAASVCFRVRVAGEEVFATGVMRPKDGWRYIELPLRGARDFELIVDEGGDGRGWDQGDWADAKVVFEDGSKAWLDELAQASQMIATFPFSFVYGGKPSAELLPTWACAVEDEQSRDAIQRTLVFTDPETGLEVRAEATFYTDTPGSDWTLYFANRGTEPTPILEQIRALDFQVRPALEAGGAIRLRRMTGSPGGGDFSPEEFKPWEEPLATGKRVEFGVSGLHPSLEQMPFFALELPGGGAAWGLGWTGAWQAEVERTLTGALQITAGLKRFRASLAPGESFRSPRILQVLWQGLSYQEGCNRFRRTMLAHILPRTEGELVLPPIAYLGSAFYELNGTTEAAEKSHIDAMKGLGFDTYWLDAYWLRGGFPNGIGNYSLSPERSADPERFSNGLQPVMDYASEQGLRQLLWFAPETVMPGTFVAEEHPGYLLSTDGGVSGTYDFGQPEAREYMTDVMDAAVKAWGLDWWRIDIGPGPQVWAQDEATPDQQGLAETDYITGLYAFLDELRARNPGLAIDNCCGGGLRLEIGRAHF